MQGVLQNALHMGGPQQNTSIADEERGQIRLCICVVHVQKLHWVGFLDISGFFKALACY